MTSQFTNEADGIQAIVTQIDAGFSVAIKDLDANEFYPSVFIYKTRDAAIAKAKEIL